MKKAFFITGTDTGVGKTFFACSLAAALVNRGLKVAAFKPMESGCERIDGKLVAKDVTKLQEATGRHCECLYTLAEPLAPAEAARIEGVNINPQSVIEAFMRIFEQNDVTLVEGAGGVLVPLADGWSVMDLMRELNIPVINVVGSKLGAINHTLLTERAVLEESLQLVGHVINNLHGASDAATLSNPDVIGALTALPVLGVLPRSENQGDWILPRIFERLIDVDWLLAQTW